MTCYLIEKMEIPESCRLGSTIFKKLFLQQKGMSSADKKLINEVIDKIIWQANLKPSTINIQPYKDDIYDYPEVEIIEVKLREKKKIRRIAEIVMLSIPYPMLIQFTYQDEILIAGGESRINQSDKSKNTIESYYFTDWINKNAPSEFEDKFLECINLSKIPHLNFFLMYQEIIKHFIFLEGSKWYLKYLNQLDHELIKKVNQELTRLELLRKEIIIQLKNEKMFNKKMELNIESKKIEDKQQNLIKMILEGIDEQNL